MDDSHDGPKGPRASRSAKVKVSTFSTEEQPKRVSLIRIGRESEKSFALLGGFIL
jgi:hypothetical protein